MSVVIRVFVPLLCLFSTSVTANADIFLVGNSLTWDSRPMLLDEPSDFHIRSGRNLKHIYENPFDLSPTEAVSWQDALTTNEYDVIVIQPHFGTTLEEDVEVISAFMDLQPDAEIVIHTGWARHEDFVAAYETTDHGGMMTHSPSYFDDLQASLQSEYADRTISRTRHIDVLYEISQDIDAGVAPFQNFSELFRDTIHATIFEGRYLAHNLLRDALGMPLSRVGFETQSGELKFSEENRMYFDEKIQIQTVPEPASASLIGLSVVSLWFGRRKRGAA